MTRCALVAAFALTLSACDAAQPAPSVLSSADLDDAAVVVASALAIDAGGVLEDAAAAASLVAPADPARQPGDRPGCDRDRAFDADAVQWTVTIDCERGTPDGRFYASFARTSTYQFFDDAGAAQRERVGAARVDYAVLSGTSRFQSPRGVHALTALAVDLSVSDLGADLVTVDGTYRRSVADTLRSRRGERTWVGTLDLALDGVRGPRSVTRRWRTAVEGTITGTLVGTRTRTPAGGPATAVEVNQSFTVTFPTEGGGRVAEIALGGRRYRADVDTGDITGLSD